MEASYIGKTKTIEKDLNERHTFEDHQPKGGKETLEIDPVAHGEHAVL